MNHSWCQWKIPIPFLRSDYEFYADELPQCRIHETPYSLECEGGHHGRQTPWQWKISVAKKMAIIISITSLVKINRFYKKKIRCFSHNYYYSLQFGIGTDFAQSQLISTEWRR